MKFSVITGHVAKESSVPVFVEIIIVLFEILSILLFLMFWHGKDAEHGFQPAYLVMEEKMKFGDL